MIGVRQNAIIDRFYQNFKNSIYHLVPALHLKQLIKFQKSLFGDSSYQQDEAFNNWLYIKRPVNKRYYCVQNNEVVGQQSALSMQLGIGSKHVSAACAVDLRVRPEWKMKGLGVAMIAPLMKKYDVIIGVGVSDEAHKMFSRQGWLDFGVIDELVKPMNMSGYNSKSSNAGFKAWLVYTLALLASNIIDYYRLCFRFYNDNNFKKITVFTEEHEHIITNVSTSNIIEIVKDKDYLNWRFIDFPGNCNYENYELIKNGLPVAYFSIKIVCDKYCKEMIISEIHSFNKYTGKIVDEIIRLASKKMVSKITYSGLNNDILKVLKSRLFYRRPYGERFLVYCRTPELESKLNCKANWHICSADSDSEFHLFDNETRP